MNVTRHVHTATKEQPNWLSFVVDEISLVDVPAVPEAQITAVKRGGGGMSAEIVEQVKALHEQGVIKTALEGLDEKQRGNIQNIIGAWEDWAGSFTRCVEQLRGKEGITNPEALCAWLHFQAVGKWPAEG